MTIRVLSTALLLGAISGPSLAQTPPPRAGSLRLDVGAHWDIGDGDRSSLLGAADCRYDDGVSEGGLGLGSFGGGEQLYLHRVGGLGELAHVTSISMAWGCPLSPGNCVPNGTSATIRIFKDPDDDGIPDDLVQLQSKAFLIAGVDTDILQTVAFNTPIDVAGIYFIGVSVISGPGEQPMAFDISTPSLNRGWFVGELNSSTGAIDYSNLPGNDAFGENSALGANGVHLLRADCQPATVISPFCAPGVGGIVTCPCGNPQVPAGATKGCNNFAAGGTGGAVLSGNGSAMISGDTLAMLVTAGIGSNVTVLFQGTVNTSNTRTGAGVRCVGGILKRLYKGNQVGGAIAFPNNGTPFHLQSIAKGYTITPPVALYYYAAYRNSAANGQPGCPGLGFGFNSTSAVAVNWTP